MEDGLEKGENGVREEGILSQTFKFSLKKKLSLSSPLIQVTAYTDLEQQQQQKSHRQHADSFH